MALTFTIAGAQSQLDALNTALAARSWSTAYDALNAYRLIRAGLVDSASSDGATLNLPDPDKLADAVDKARARSALQSDTGRRLARGRVRHA